MKTFFLFSDINQGLIIGGIITAVITPLMALIISYLNKVIAKQDLIHNEMNGMKSELVEATAALNEALGKEKGRDQLKQEQKELKQEQKAEQKEEAQATKTEATKTEVSEVVIVENKDKEVIIKKNLDKSVGDTL